MSRRKNNVIIFTVIFTSIILVFSCKTTSLFDYKNPYPNMETVYYGDSHAYVFRNNASDKLLIILESIGWESTLGIQTNEGWPIVGVGGLLLPVLSDSHSIVILEKLKRQSGKNYYEDMEDRANYTAGNLIDCYVESINGYLAENTFSSVVIAGFSEGACLLPLVYERINDKDRVKALVSMGYGGFSMYESYNTWSLRQNTLPEEKMNFQYIMEIYKPGDDDYPDSYTEDVLGMTYRWFNSFIHIKPFEYYSNINIPVLFIHGEYDSNVPAESTAYIQENLPEKPFSYKYFPWEHAPKEKDDIIVFRKELVEWIMEIDKQPDL